MGAIVAADSLCRERQPNRPRPVDDRMSVCFEVCPPRTEGGIPERDAMRVRMARRVTTAWLRFCGLDMLLDDAQVIVSELVTNAIQHGTGAQVTFTMTVRDGFLRLAVHDETPGRPVVRHADDDAERGRGLFLVDCLAAAHGGTWAVSDDGTTTWCCLAVPGGQS
ncbi:ATP-binding protein [Streptomyces sp. NPDC047860]|uniref:ATP-binding protein n=1 Tax=Streptomyces sp. NPDC047860 TaxID=3155743 RepID=UPI0033D0449E